MALSNPHVLICYKTKLNQTLCTYMNKRLHSPFLKKSDLGIAKNYMDVNLTAIDLKVYDANLPNPFARAGYDTSSIFKQSLTGLNSEFSFS